MSSSEVKQLRNAGNYKEALELAIQERNENDNEWTQMSLFWSLYQYCKNVLIPQGDKDTAKEYLDRMGELLPTMRDDKGLGEKCYQKMHNMLLPHADVMRRCNDLAKSDPEQAMKELLQIPLTEIDDSQHESYGWILYRYLKVVMADSYDGDMLSDMNQLLNTYLGLHCERPSLLHSAVLFVVLKYAKTHDDFDFNGFFTSWNPENLREEDWKGKTTTDTDGKKHEYKSLAEECADLCYKAVKMTNDKGAIEWLTGFYEEVLQKNPSNENCIRNCAQLYILSGDKDKARELYSKIILQAGNKYYLWHEYALLVEENDVKIGLLLKALTLEKNEDYIGSIHLALAEALIVENFFGKAWKELEAVYTHYQKKGWRVPRKYYTLKQSCEGKQDSKDFDRNHYLGVAEAYVYSSLTLKYGVVDYINEEKKTLQIVDTDSRTHYYRYKKTSLKAGNIVVFRQGNTDPKKILTLKAVPKAEALSKFECCKVVVDNVNEDKKLFHLTGLDQVKDAVVKFDETGIRPNVGDAFDVIFVNNNKGRSRILDIKESEADDDRLSTTVEGTLTLKRRRSTTPTPTSHAESPRNSLEADYGFVDDCYVPKAVLSKCELMDGGEVIAKAVISKDGRWIVYDIKEKENAD